MSEYTLNPPFTLTCPDCGGALRPSSHAPLLKFTCHIGHVFTAEAMFEAQADRVEFAATSFLAMLNERVELCRRMLAAGQDENGVVEEAKRTASENAEALRKFLSTTKLT